MPDPDTYVIILLFVMLLVACIAGIVLKAKLEASELKVVQLLKDLSHLEARHKQGNRLNELRTCTLETIKKLLEGF